MDRNMFSFCRTGAGHTGLPGTLWRTIFASGCMLCLTGQGETALERLRADRRQAAQSQRRIIFDNDGCDAWYFPLDKEATPENLLAVRTAPLLGSQVGSVAYCTISSGFSNFTHNTKVGAVLSAPRSETVKRKNITPDLIARGTDPLRVVGDFCHENGLEIFWSMRMNDTHDGAHKPGEDPVYPLWPKLKEEHPEYLIGTFENRPRHGSWTAVDYTRPEIRDLAFRYIEEVCSNYDVDGIELDFFRHMSYFRSVAFGGEASRKERRMMTDLIRRIRWMTEREGLKRKRPILVAVRVVDSAEYSKRIGLDWQQWLKEGLVDILIPSGYSRLNPWDYSVRIGHKYGVQVYAGLSESRVQEPRDHPHRRQSTESYRARAMDAWRAGVDGIYIFNVYNAAAQFLSELGDPEQLQKLDKLYFATVRNGAPDSYLTRGERFMNLPVLTPVDQIPLLRGEQVVIPMWIGDDVRWGEKEGVAADIVCRLQIKGVTDLGSITCTLNGESLTQAELAEPWIQYRVAPGLVKTGRNEFGIMLGRRHEGKTPEVPGSEDDQWDVVYIGDKKFIYPEQLPWRRLFTSDDWLEEVRDGALYFADRSAANDAFINLCYPWNATAADEAVAQVCVKVESSTDPLGVCVRVANGRTAEFLTLESDGIGLLNAGVSCAMNTADAFHTYRIVTRNKDIKVYVDGELRLDGTGKYTHSVEKKPNWVNFMEAPAKWNRCSFMLGSASGPGTGAAYWKSVKLHTQSKSISDLLMTIGYRKK